MRAATSTRWASCSMNWPSVAPLRHPLHLRGNPQPHEGDPAAALADPPRPATPAGGRDPQGTCQGPQPTLNDGAALAEALEKLPSDATLVTAEPVRPAPLPWDLPELADTVSEEPGSAPR